MPIYGQLGYIIVYQKENRRTLSGDWLFPKNNKTWSSSTSIFINFWPLLEKEFYFLSIKRYVVDISDEGALVCSHYY